MNLHTTKQITDQAGKKRKGINDALGRMIRVIEDPSGQNLNTDYSTELNPSPQLSYLTSDHLGSPRIITDGAGAVISRHDYMAFGDEVTQKLGNVGGRSAAQGYGKADDVRKQYTGYERDKESGLDYAQARYYNSNHGRFTSVDPLMASAETKNPQTFNRYTYVLNSPYKFTDPLGLLPQSSGFCGAENSSCEQGEELTTRSEEEYRRQRAEEADPPPAPDPDAEPPATDPTLAAQEQKLAEVFTTGDAIVRSDGRDANSGDSANAPTHFRTPDGKIHTIHVYGNQEGTASANVYVPEGFIATYMGGEYNFVYAYNKKTKELIVYSHIAGINSQADLNKNLKITNDAGSRLIGQIGGPGGQDKGYIHSHISIYSSRDGFKLMKAQKYGREYKGKQLEVGYKDLSGFGDFSRFAK